MGNKLGNLAMNPIYAVTNCCELKKPRLAQMFSLTVAEGSAVYVTIHSQLHTQIKRPFML
jgi:hypothetical protein